MYYNWDPYEGYMNGQQPGYGYHPNWQNWYRQINMVDAINIALQQVPGEAVEAELKTRQGRRIYEVEIVTAQGTKYEVEVDRNTGEIVDVELD